MRRVTWINLLLGIWLVIAPYVMFRGVATPVWTTNDVILGILLIAFSWWILGAVAAPVGVAWLQIFCGIWLIVAPFVLAYRGPGVINDVVCGIIAIVVAVIASRDLARTPTVA